MSPNCATKRYPDVCGFMDDSRCFSSDEELPEFTPRLVPPPAPIETAEEKLVHVVSVLDDLTTKFGLQEAMRGSADLPEQKDDETFESRLQECIRRSMDPTRTDDECSIPAYEFSPSLKVGEKDNVCVPPWQVLSTVTFFSVVILLLCLITVFSAETAINLILAMICYSLVDIGIIYITKIVIKLYRKYVAAEENIVNNNEVQ